MAAVVIPYPKTPAGRALLKENIGYFPDISTWLALRLDWDEEAKWPDEFEGNHRQTRGAK